MAGRYRALLIGNSTYPADEHNLQTLKGPVKDIAVLNRALIDPVTGLFADVDVTLLPEATSARAIRALGRFFGTATRDEVLLVYFSGHGKLDQSGRLHLCMQDTESADLLSTAVSSARIKEFADASRARNVVIVLDCCYAGAFRGADLGDAVAGPGHYVLTSCRGTQLANDATVENGTSFFTQHLVDGLVNAAADQDGDGYVTFSDLYAYVDQRLREAGKQIPQRRVDGDGDVPLAKRPQPAPAEAIPAGGTPPVLEVSPTRLDLGEIPPGHIAELRVSNRGGGDLDWTYDAAEDFYHVERTQLGLLFRFGHQPGHHEGHLIIRSNGGLSDIGITTAICPVPPKGLSASSPMPPGPTVAGNGTGGTAQASGGLRHGGARRWILIAAAAVVVVGGIVAALLLLSSGSGGSSPASGSFIAKAPWRLQIVDHILPSSRDNGCNITLTDTHSGAKIPLPIGQYHTSILQVHQTGSFRWQVNDPAGCTVVPLATSGTVKLPFPFDQVGYGDSNAFVAPKVVAVRLTGHRNGNCKIALYDPVSGQPLGPVKLGKGTVTFDTHGSPTAYLQFHFCHALVLPAH